MGDKCLKEEPLFTPNVKIDRLTIVFKLIISFPASNNPFHDAIILVEESQYLNIYKKKPALSNGYHR